MFSTEYVLYRTCSLEEYVVYSVTIYEALKMGWQNSLASQASSCNGLGLGSPHFQVLARPGSTCPSKTLLCLCVCDFMHAMRDLGEEDLIDKKPNRMLLHLLMIYRIL